METSGEMREPARRMHAALDDYNYGYASDGGPEPLWTRFQRRVSDFLCFCAGADTQILRHCPHSERVKEQGIGGVVLATATLAFCSGSYGFYTVFSSKKGYALSTTQQEFDWIALGMAIVFGLLWSLMIFNLDRFIVSTGGHGDGTEKITLSEFVRAIPRIIMAVVIGVVLSKPLEIRIMKTEIDARLTALQKDYAAELQKKDDAEYERSRKELDDKKAAVVSKRDDRESKISALEDRTLTQRDKVDAEADGSATGRAGIGPAYGVKSANLGKIETELKRMKEVFEPELKTLNTEIAALQAQIDQLVRERDANVEGNRQKAASQDGLIKRIEIASEISPVASGMLTVLMIVLEIAPIFFKMMVSIGPYDYLSENVRRRTIAMRGIAIKDEIQTRETVELNDAVYYQAETLVEHERGKLEVERKLTDVALDEYRKRVASDIKANPDKYQTAVVETHQVPV